MYCLGWKGWVFPPPEPGVEGRGGAEQCLALSKPSLTAGGVVPLQGLDKRVCLKSQPREVEAAGSVLGTRFVHLS